MNTFPHQYIERRTGEVVTEKIISDYFVNLIYSNVRENAKWLFNALTSSAMTRLLGYLQFDLFYKKSMKSVFQTVNALNIDLSECVNAGALTTPRKLFERQIRYWENRPMSPKSNVIASPADARVIAGALSETSCLFLKNKFFTYEELLGRDKQNWLQAFEGGDYMIFRLTPDKYHYNHFPVSGKVVDYYEIDGRYHSCNPGAVIKAVTPYSINKRVVTIIDTDVENGTQVGLVAMIEIVALMIGDIQQCYSELKYDNPRILRVGMYVEKGQPKSLYRPGSSVDVILFQKGMVVISQDIIQNMRRRDVNSRYSAGFQKPLVETDVAVRSDIGVRAV